MIAPITALKLVDAAQLPAENLNLNINMLSKYPWQLILAYNAILNGHMCCEGCGLWLLQSR